MNMNWKIVKVIGAFAIITGIIIWTFIATRAQSYSGTDLNFEVASGLVIITNPSQQSVPVQFSQSGTRSFTLRSNIDGVTGNSTRLDTDGNAMHLFELELPSGISEFTITRGDDVMFVASSTSELDAIVNPMTAETSRNVVIAALVAVVALLFYASNVMEHSWIRMLTGKGESPEDTSPSPVVESAQGRSARSFGDNRSS